MERLIIEGGARLCGEAAVHGAKNSALPILAASLLTKKTILHNCPRLSDVGAACGILKELGCKVDRLGESVFIEADNVVCRELSQDKTREMRSSILFLGAILARCGRARVSFPGGCELGARPVDIHIESLKKLGAVIEEDHGFFDCRAPERLHGANLTLSFPSVGATENIMLAAVTAKGITTVQNAAREPEINDLAAFLNGCGAKIAIHGDFIEIEGVDELSDAEHTVIPDRIEAATYLCSAAITGGELRLKNVCPHHLLAVLPVLEGMGCQIKTADSEILLSAPQRLKAVSGIKTMPYPGFPTDAQAPVMAALCTASGTSVIVENIFDARFKHAGELLRMGAKINIEGRVAVIEGVKRLHSATVHSTDLRGGAALAVAALSADGVTELLELHHIDRGYQDFEKTLCALGAKITRER